MLKNFHSQKGLKMTFGLGEILIITAAALLLFGAGRIPQVMEDLGKGISSFKKGLKDGVN